MPTRELLRILLVSLSMTLAACGGGGSGGGGGTTPPPDNNPGGGNGPGDPEPEPDTTPETVAINDVVALPGATVTLPAFTVKGINRPIPLAVSGEGVTLEYSLDGGKKFLADTREIQNQENVVLRVTAPGEFGQSGSATLTLGEMHTTFAVGTPAEPASLELTPGAHKRLGFSWGGVPEGLVDHFVLIANRRGIEGFNVVLADAIAGTESEAAIDVAAWEGAMAGTRYRLEGCTSDGYCVSWPGEPFLEGGQVDQIVQYRKDVNHLITENARYSGNGGTYPARTLKLDNAGRHLFIGLPDRSTEDGKVQVLRRDETNKWISRGHIDPPVAAQDGRFGGVVELSGDEQWLFVGAPKEDRVDPERVDAGAVHVYRATDTGGWAYHQTLDFARAHAQSGYSISSNHDGSVVAVAAPFDDLTAASTSANFGSLRVFRRNGEFLEGEATLSLMEENGNDEDDRFGFSISLNDAGDVLAAGVPRHDYAGQDLGTRTEDNTGTVIIYRHDGVAWSREHVLKSQAQKKEALFGHYVLLSRDGQQLFVTSDGGATTGTSGRGSVEVFDGAAGWAFVQALIPPFVSTSIVFGNSLALSNDGMRLAVSDPQQQRGDPGLHLASEQPGLGDVYRSGTVYVFERRNGVWEPDAYLRSPFPDTDDRYGGSLSLSGDGKTLAVGVPLEDGKGGTEDGVPVGPDNNDMPNSGAIFIY